MTDANVDDSLARQMGRYNEPPLVVVKGSTARRSRTGLAY
jgi:hypothetical protein